MRTVIEDIEGQEKPAGQTETTTVDGTAEEGLRTTTVTIEPF